MIYILWLNCIYIYKIKRNFPSAFSFAYRETSKASSLFIFMNEHVKTYIQLCKYTILNMHIHSLVADAKLCFCTVNKPCVSALTKGTVPQGASSVKKLYFWIMWETSHVGRTGQAPSWWRHKGKKQLWPHSLCKPLWESCTTCSCLFGPASSSFLIPSTISLPGTCISLRWTSQGLGDCLEKLCKAWLSTETSAPCLSRVQDEPQQILSHLVALGVVTTLRHMERGQLPDQLSFPCLIS